MRVTIDIDHDFKPYLYWSLLKGFYFLKRRPNLIRKTERGWHIVYRFLKIDRKTAYKYRYMLGDDTNRIKLDRLSTRRIKDVLFSEKSTTIFGSIHPAWFSKVMHIKSPSPYYNICPFCFKEVSLSRKIWERDKKVIEIEHKGSDRICTFPLRAG